MGRGDALAGMRTLVVILLGILAATAVSCGAEAGGGPTGPSPNRSLLPPGAGWRCLDAGGTSPWGACWRGCAVGYTCHVAEGAWCYTWGAATYSGGYRCMETFSQCSEEWQRAASHSAALLSTCALIP